MDENLYYLLALYFQKGIGAVTAKNLISYCGSARDVFFSKKNTLLKTPGIGSKILASINLEHVKKQIDDELLFIEKNKIRVFSYYDVDYPQRLKHCNDSPLLLFTKGNTNLNTSKIVNIVGTRHATEYGRYITQQIVEGLAMYNTTIVSGLALGIDTIAHKAALAHNLPTIAVLGHGMHIIYPDQNKGLASKIVEQGMLITEYNSKSIFDKSNFPNRNRIVAGMCDATIMIESAESGGAMITCELADQYHRDVFAVPGRTTDKYSQGANKLIKNLKAQMITEANDLVKALNWDQKSKIIARPTLFLDLSEEEQIIVTLIREQNEISIDNILEKTQFNTSKLSNILLQLEMNGIIKTLPGKRYMLLE